MLTKIYKTLRINNWWNTKLPPLWGIAFLLIYTGDISLLGSLPRLAAMLIWMIGAAGFGHYLNDWADIEQDQRAGKPNAASDHTPRKRWLIAAGLFILALAPWLLLCVVLQPANYDNSFWLPVETTLIPVIVHLLSFILYSAPPVRLKERGSAGVVMDALYAHVIPSIVVIMCFAAEPSFLLFACLVGWQLFLGLRHIIFHQVEDVQNDRLAKSKTWMTGVAIVSVFRFVRFGLLPFELLAFLAIAVLSQPFLLMGAFLVFVLLKYLMRNSWQFPDDPIVRSVHVISAYVSNFYEQIFPWLFLVLLIVTVNIHFVWIAVLQFLLYPKPLQQFWHDVHYLPQQIRKG